MLEFNVLIVEEVFRVRFVIVVIFLDYRMKKVDKRRIVSGFGDLEI